MQFSRKIMKSQKEIFFARIKAWYCSDIDSGLFCASSTINTFSGSWSTFVHVRRVVKLLSHKCNFPGKSGGVRNKFSLQEYRLDTVLTSVLVYFVLAPLLALFSGSLHLCTSCELYSYYYTNVIFQKNQEELETIFWILHLSVGTLKFHPLATKSGQSKLS